jgi:enamine deaminase RidA (YjgF/YER057c/UK114 family)
MVKRSKAAGGIGGLTRFAGFSLPDCAAATGANFRRDLRYDIGEPAFMAHVLFGEPVSTSPEHALAGEQGRTTMNLANWAAAAMAMLGASGAAGAAEYMEKTDFQKSRAFSPAVITQGGRIVWMAGQTTTRDEAGNDISGNFEAQVRTVFSLMDKTLQKAGGSLANLVTMTVFINDPRNGDRFVEMRRDTFKDGNYPASALITVSNFARPGMLIEIQGIAVIGDAQK